MEGYYLQVLEEVLYTLGGTSQGKVQSERAGPGAHTCIRICV